MESESNPATVSSCRVSVQLPRKKASATGYKSKQKQN